MRLKLHEYELLLSIAVKMYKSDDFQDYEAEFISHLSDNVKMNKKQLKEINNN
jgi:hypothetical protein